MPIALHLDNTFWEIGSSSFLNSFFSTVSVHLEPNGFGTRFPRLKELYDDGHLPAGLADQASGELNEARRELSRLTPDRVTWDSDAAVEHGDVGGAIGRLSPELRMVVQATLIDGLTTREAGRFLGIPAGTVKTRMMRARAQLREALL